ncbi:MULTISPECIES: glycerophosphodiester phosphodiesterase family protein [unclassified Burkholderia]|uniref:glycerophosphodiester phosphodiesterase family protein n=1 Tax=unclassified Burkholderia TaxID=2613784 RepID=UPI000757BA48|nr:MULTISPECIES: glycerophosphodiester phosphodiesterase family protein [unclassified Burkholderia]KVN09101.1 glycerophosphodiester phosphodiesterase [Burkholderia sp. MSMB1552]KWZ57090.1 glycerophosphodiester phosphodiesterase [Burkholderia sp. MSMB1588]
MNRLIDIIGRRAALAGVALGLAACAGGGPVGEAPATLPRIVAHRGGAADAPENTLDAIRAAIANRADAIWLTVQLSRDGVPVLYRPADLSALTQSSGPVAGYTAAQLARMNAGWHFRDASGQYPYRTRAAGIPTLRDALRAIPPAMPIVLDMKAVPAAPQAKAVADVLTSEAAWPRMTIYSTDAAYQAAFAPYPHARLFESRDATRGRLVNVLLGGACERAPDAPNASYAPVWAGFEMHRNLTVSERFTLGEGVSSVTATLWTPATVACFRRRANVRILAIAVNDADDYRAAACLGLDAVLADSPRKMAEVEAALRARPLRCDAAAR